MKAGVYLLVELAEPFSLLFDLALCRWKMLRKSTRSTKVHNLFIMFGAGNYQA